MQLLQRSGNLAMESVRRLLSILTKKKLLRTAGLDLPDQFGLDNLIALLSERLGPLLGLVVKAIDVRGVTTIAHPGHNRIFQEGIEPGADQGITDLYFVIQE